MGRLGSPVERLCLDTGLLIQTLRDTSPGSEATQKVIREATCYVAAITVYELMLGVARRGRDIGEDALLGVFTVLPLDNEAARRTAMLHDTLIRQNQQIGIKDMLIAATCLIYGLPILTLNTRHFERVPGLTVLTPEDVLLSPNDRI